MKKNYISVGSRHSNNGYFLKELIYLQTPIWPDTQQFLNQFTHEHNMIFSILYLFKQRTVLLFNKSYFKFYRHPIKFHLFSFSCKRLNT